MAGQNPPRDWQTNARVKLKQHWLENSSFRALIAACPGAGKTYFAVSVADEILRQGTVELVLVAVPTINVQIQWVEEFEKFGINATMDANNEALRWRRDAGGSMIEDKAAIVVTYQQLARDRKLFGTLVKRHKTLLIADEVHHADDDAEYGKALSEIKEAVVHSLALSGTPFNTEGGLLALCETMMAIDEETGKPVAKTVPTYEYPYGQAINEDVCRPVNFVKVEGRGRATYHSLTDNTFFEKIILTARKSDPIGLFLSPDGEYMQQCIREGLTALAMMREAGDKKAAMLVVAEDVRHGNRLIEAIERIKQERPEWRQFSNIQEIYNDTVRAHDRIAALVSDNTDIVVSVRMISEGVDVKRLRVGIYATNWMTRMFFIQFVGRFIRIEKRAPLDQTQHAVVVIPARPDLLRWARQIEEMILASQIRLVTGVEGPEHERMSELVECETEAENTTLTFRGTESAYEKNLIEMMCQKSPMLRSMAPSQVIQLAKDFGFADASVKAGSKKPINWSKRNDDIVSQIVRLMRANDESDDELYSRVNGKANSHVGIQRKDKMTAEDTLKRRWEFLRQWLLSIVRETNPDLFAQYNQPSV